MRVYVVTRDGQYPDEGVRVVGIFSSYELAKQRWGELFYSIEEWEIEDDNSNRPS